ncbi:hypothetical protein GBAR_LOCUS7012 [Geodia barretti]|uniref:Uncharacterized protein n=1 Tax=Geodia barretti TaxID=519541 RepID=A0AA35W7Z5_GEOBA|nr:hypothetical protein GBAR_LOCUS7012 [Geodia barretti]
MLLLRVRGLLVVCVWWSCVSSSQLGPENCTATVAINQHCQIQSLSTFPLELRVLSASLTE